MRCLVDDLPQLLVHGLRLGQARHDERQIQLTQQLNSSKGGKLSGIASGSLLPVDTVRSYDGMYGKEKTTLLHLCVRWGRLACLRVLVELGHASISCRGRVLTHSVHLPIAGQITHLVYSVSDGERRSLLDEACNSPLAYVAIARYIMDVVR